MTFYNNSNNNVMSRCFKHFINVLTKTFYYYHLVNVTLNNGHVDNRTDN